MGMCLFKKLSAGLLLGAVLSAGCTMIGNNNSKEISESFKPGELWLDSDSVHINAHGGGLLYHEGTYYWYGEHKTSGRGGNTSLLGLRCYSSEDLYNWKNEGIALASVDDPESEITHGCVMERPKVIYNATTKQFVMWFHLELKGQGYAAARTALAVSDTPTGPFTYVKSTRVNANVWPLDASQVMKSHSGETKYDWWTPEWRKEVEDGLFVALNFKEGQMSRDMTLFVDDDGTAYHIHSAEENLTLHISELTPDYKDFTGKWIRVAPGGHNEAPAVFKHQDKYYMITSGCTGWDPNEARLMVADSMMGPWKYMGNPCQGKDAELTFHSQSTYILPVAGKKDAFIFMGDRWMPRNPIDGRYIWLPVIFENNLPVIKWYDQWDLSFFDKEI
ncbi:family 43 glycosylhydrolase [Marinilabiliaceae bacterium A049]|nr:family 43 glycosylhydrolase [Marinilabiliaceae bacterium A049]